ncbi:putative nuclease HARBI1 [Prorops nasuta]|uniref:putative nuclease HARBI1 n=1 Tax=Prorops nasuta TaxID=863751 RepID=UPI0034CD68EA
MDKISCSLAIKSLVEEIMIQSDTDSDSDTELIYNYLRIISQSKLIPHVTCKNYVSKIVLAYSDVEFKSHFRIERSTFVFILELLTPYLEKNCKRYGRLQISPEQQLLIAIWMLATPSSFRCVSDRFGVSKSTSWHCTMRVVIALYKKVNLFIKWPSANEGMKTMEATQRKYGFPGVLGAIDGTHVKIVKPEEHPEAYINRKGYYSIQLQVVCDHELKFINCYAGQVGSVHDMRVFKLSNFSNLLNEENFPNNSHLLGDAAYTINKYILTPFKDYGNLNGSEVAYNNRHSSARMMIERAIGLLKIRFRSILDKLRMTRTKLISKYIIACCIMHNICILQRDHMEIPVIVNNIIHSNTSERNQDVQNALKQEGLRKRENITNLFRT